MLSWATCTSTKGHKTCHNKAVFVQNLSVHYMYYLQPRQMMTDNDNLHTMDLLMSLLLNITNHLMTGPLRNQIILPVI